jgi:dTDP-4-dehydrorhamnose 3,5-epimerase
MLVGDITLMNKYSKSTTFNDVYIFYSEKFVDHRGGYVETYNDGFFKSIVSGVEFIQDDYSTSKQGVLRGLHGDDSTWKLVSCPYGVMYFVIVDNRKESKTYLQWESFVLTEEQPKFILIPPGFANGHLVLSDVAIFNYKQSQYYGTKQFTIKYDDPRLNIFWPIGQPVQSRRDLGL